MKKRKFGEVLLDLEIVLDEMCDHDLQWGDILALVHMHLQVHRPDAKEEYLDGDTPIFFYGPEFK